MISFVPKEFVNRVKIMLEGTNELHLHASADFALLFEQALRNQIVVRIQGKSRTYFAIETKREASGIKVLLAPIEAPRKKNRRAKR